MQDAGLQQFKPLFSYNVWRSTWYAFLGLLQWGTKLLGQLI